MRIIKKHYQGNPITTSGSGYIPAAQPSPEQLKDAANVLGTLFLKGLGVIGLIVTAPFTYSDPRSNIYKSSELLAQESAIQNEVDRQMGTVMSYLSPLNYGVALATGNGLNPEKGAYEVETWEPYLLALGRGLEVYLTPKALRMGKKSVQRGILEVSRKKLPYTSPELNIFPVENSINTGYTVENYPGYLIKSLMAGSPLERYLSKTGTININLLRGYLSKASKLELNIVEKVLNEKFNGLKAVDYNQLKRAVLEELITYTRKPQTRWATYGLNRLGYEVIKEPDGAGGIVEYTNFPVQTFTFESPRLPKGSGKHYDSSSLGHSRTFTTKTEPEVLHILESLSDWGQTPLPDPISNILSDIENGKHITNAVKRFLRYVPEKWKADYERLIRDTEKYNADFPDEVVATYSQDFQDFVDQLFNSKFKWPSDDAIYRLHKATYVSEPQRTYLHDNYPRRQLQENIKFASERGQTKLRYPTRETAAKIEGFTPVPREGHYIIDVNEALANYLKENSRKLTPYSYELLELKTKLDKTSDPIKRNNIISEIKRIQRLEDRYLNGEVTYESQFETILDKYSLFPKLFNKLYKNQEVHIVSDINGNTWYEVDVPQNYLNSEWQLRHGGKLNKRNETYKEISSKW